jgi:hypothetical protein
LLPAASAASLAIAKQNVFKFTTVNQQHISKNDPLGSSSAKFNFIFRAFAAFPSNLAQARMNAAVARIISEGALTAYALSWGNSTICNNCL